MKSVRKWLSCVAVMAVLGLFAEQVWAVMLWDNGNPTNNGATYGSAQSGGVNELDGKYVIDAGSGKLTVTIRGFCTNFSCEEPEEAGTIVTGKLTVTGTVGQPQQNWTRVHDGVATACPGSSAEYEAFVYVPSGGTVSSAKVDILAECTCCDGVNPVEGEYPDEEWEDRDVTPS